MLLPSGASFACHTRRIGDTARMVNRKEKTDAAKNVNKRSDNGAYISQRLYSTLFVLVFFSRFLHPFFFDRMLLVECVQMSR